MDELSRPPNADQGQDDNEDQMLLKPELFIKRIITTPTEAAKRQLMTLVTTLQGRSMTSLFVRR